MTRARVIYLTTC